MTRHKYEILALILQTSFRGEASSDGVAKCRLSYQASKPLVVN